eukprot:TRINITY_DN18863_c0_g1_i1.p1 TRINITY_DN18863_c0_g1~~TRINITY_DN18863_c0_g1_i1.p1  ORF type:complete len:353 (-),score=102.53 TRINITY_DN18863_c0_g1_i1:35-1093(-)
MAVATGEAEVDSALPFCRSLAKAELHAHLGGSVRQSTLRELLIAKGLPVDGLDQAFSRVRRDAYGDCFRVFDAVHAAVDSLAVLRRVARECVEDFAADGAAYCEIRTTPRAGMLPAGSTKRQYVEAVLAGLHDGCAATGTRAGLLLSVDRGSDTPATAADTVDVAVAAVAEGGDVLARVVGIDFSGNPYKGHFSDYVPALRRARAACLRIALHFSERPDGSDPEMAAMLAFGADRIGHALYIDDPTTAALVASPLPLEVCLSSSVQTRSCASPVAHPGWAQLRRRLPTYPLVLCTDDKCVFNTSLAREYAIAATAWHLTHDDLRALADASLEYSFAPAEWKTHLLARLQAKN